MCIGRTVLVSRFRCGCYGLHVDTGQFKPVGQRVDKEQRFCPVCGSELGCHGLPMAVGRLIHAVHVDRADRACLACSCGAIMLGSQGLPIAGRLCHVSISNLALHLKVTHSYSSLA